MTSASEVDTMTYARFLHATGFISDHEWEMDSPHGPEAFEALIEARRAVLMSALSDIVAHQITHHFCYFVPPDKADKL